MLELGRGGGGRQRSCQVKRKGEEETQTLGVPATLPQNEPHLGIFQKGIFAHSPPSLPASQAVLVLTNRRRLCKRLRERDLIILLMMQKSEMILLLSLRAVLGTCFEGVLSWVTWIPL